MSLPVPLPLHLARKKTLDDFDYTYAVQADGHEMWTIRWKMKVIRTMGDEDDNAGMTERVETVDLNSSQ